MELPLTLSRTKTRHPLAETLPGTCRGSDRYEAYTSYRLLHHRKQPGAQNETPVNSTLPNLSLAEDGGTTTSYSLLPKTVS
jgi:hypothetical protein